MRLHFLVIGLLITMSGTLPAAPPSVTTLNPGGGQRGTSGSVVVTGTFDTWPVQIWSSTPGVVGKAEKEKGKVTITLAADAPLGVAWLRFHNASGASQLRPFIVGGLPEVAEVEPNDAAKTASIITTPTVVNGTLEKRGDVDCFAVKLTKGQTLVASLEAHRTLRSPMDAVLQLLSTDGAVLIQNHDARGLDPELAYTAAADGTYIVRLFAYPAMPDSTIGHFGSPACVYRLTLTTSEFIDFATPLAVEKDRPAKLTLRGWNLKEPTAQLAGTEDRIGTANTVFISRELHPCYDLPPVSENPLTPPFTATSHLEKATLTSVITLTGMAGKSVTIRIDSETLGLSLTPILKIKDSKGKQLLLAEPAVLHGSIETTFTPPTNDSFRMEVSDLFGATGPRHYYRLRATPALPDVEARLTTDRFTLTAGTPLDIPITITRKNGFTGDLVPYGSGLPAGVTVELAPIVKPDPKTVTVRLTASKAVASGPIRLGVGKKDDDKFRRLATTKLVDFDQDTSELWLMIAGTGK